MRYHLLPFILALAFAGHTFAQHRVILDTDPGYDPDDVGCMAMLHSLANMGKCEILAMVNSTDMKHSPVCISAINQFYGRKEIPVGTYKGYQTIRDSPEDVYTWHIAKKYPATLKSWDDAPDAVALYREILAGAEDTSITIVITGTMHNFYDLLRSSPCFFSDRDGIGLVRKKVKLVATMGGNFIDGRGYDRTNWGGADSLCAYTSWSCLNEERNSMCRYVIEHCPAPFVASGWEVGCGDYFNAAYGNVMTGQGLKELNPDHIVRQSYEYHFRFRGGDQNIDRHSNDQCALHYALRGEGLNYKATLGGNIDLSPSGVCSWLPSETGRQGYIQKKRDKELIALEIEALMMGKVLDTDSSLPEAPAGLVCSRDGSGTTLSWEPSRDTTEGSWVIGYNIYRNGEFLNRAYGLKYLDNESPEENIRYEIRAVNAHGIESTGAILLSSAGNATLSMEETSYEGRPHILVKTSALDYYYDVRGGGFSRIIDKRGRDWVSFTMEPWGQYPASAASSFRGLPNLVFQGEDDGAGHPGHDRCSSYMDGNRIYTESNSGKWKWCWEFQEDHAILEVLKTDPDRSYWFLYEGTPGGNYNPGKTYFGSDRGGPHPGGYNYYKGDIGWGQYQWLYTGIKDVAGTFYLLQEKADDLMDMVSFLGNTELGLESPDGMTVFGFGREDGATPLLTGKQRFVIGLYPEKIEDTEDHQKLSEYLNSRFQK